MSADEIEAFVRDHPYWIGDWAAHAGPDAIADQVRFAREWGVVREHARARGISILGDIPFYVAPDSADARSHPELFQRGEVAGVPPDDWSATGQHWGNPVYDWRAMRNDRFRWWVERFRRTLELVDAVRIDHFRGFVAYWSIPEQYRTARHGHWRRSPGRDVFETVWRELGPVPVVAENLGVITPAVEGLREEFGMPGCVVLQFVFSESLRNRPPPPTDDNVVIYTGTHDNDTTNGWWSGLSPRARARVDAELARLDIDETRPSWKLIRLAFASNADTAIVPAQDLLDLGARARMNHPGRTRGSWRWQLQPGMLGADLAAELRELTESSRRIGPRSRTALVSQRAAPEKSLIVDGSPGRRP